MNEKWKQAFKQSYDKGKSQSYALLHDKTDTAIINAKQTLKSAKNIGDMNPSTNVHELVEYLQNLKKPK